MIKKNCLFIFDLDGVLLDSQGYHRALQSSLRRFAAALGAPQTEIDIDQISRFETLHVTNEWDILAICVALILVYVWQVDSEIRIRTTQPIGKIISDQPDFHSFLDLFPADDSLPYTKALGIILENNPLLNQEQKEYLTHILLTCRDIYSSPTLPVHQEIILGSKVFQKHYRLAPILNEESYLRKFDRSAMKPETIRSISSLLSLSSHAACVMTNRPSKTPPGYLSSPEAELGLANVEINELPYIASGILRWYANVVLKNPDFVLLKPNPTHTLASLRKCMGESVYDSVEKSFLLWNGIKTKADWENLNQSRVVVFEDSTKGLLSAKAAQKLLAEIGVGIDLELIGVTSNPIKVKALKPIADRVVGEINHINWDQYR